MTIDVNIMAVLSRKSFAEKLLNRLPKDCGAKITYDYRGYNGCGNCWYNARDIWGAKTNCSHKLVLSDDTILVDGFYEIIKKCVEYKPDAIWSFYVGNKAFKNMPKSDLPYCKINGCKTGGLAIIIPTQYIQHMITETDHYFGTDYKYDGGRIGWFALNHNIELFTTNIAIADHNTELKSTIRGHNSKARHCPFWIGYDVSSVDWNIKAHSESKKTLPYFWLTEKDAYFQLGKTYCKRGELMLKNGGK